MAGTVSDVRARMTGSRCRQYGAIICGVFTYPLFVLVKSVHASHSSFDPSMPSTSLPVPGEACPPIAFRFARGWD